jgi:hypothetical protein
VNSGAEIGGKGFSALFAAVETILTNLVQPVQRRFTRLLKRPEFCVNGFCSVRQRDELSFLLSQTGRLPNDSAGSLLLQFEILANLPCFVVNLQLFLICSMGYLRQQLLCGQQLAPCGLNRFLRFLEMVPSLSGRVVFWRFLQVSSMLKERCNLFLPFADRFRKPFDIRQPDSESG